MQHGSCAESDAAREQPPCPAAPAVVTMTVDDNFPPGYLEFLRKQQAQLSHSQSSVLVQYDTKMPSHNRLQGLQFRTASDYQNSACSSCDTTVPPYVDRHSDGGTDCQLHSVTRIQEDGVRTNFTLMLDLELRQMLYQISALQDYNEMLLLYCTAKALQHCHDTVLAIARIRDSAWDEWDDLMIAANALRKIVVDQQLSVASTHHQDLIQFVISIINSPHGMQQLNQSDSVNGTFTSIAQCLQTLMQLAKVHNQSTCLRCNVTPQYHAMIPGLQSMDRATLISIANIFDMAWPHFIAESSTSHAASIRSGLFSKLPLDVWTHIMLFLDMSEEYGSWMLVNREWFWMTWSRALLGRQHYLNIADFCHLFGSNHVLGYRPERRHTVPVTATVAVEHTAEPHCQPGLMPGVNDVVRAQTVHEQNTRALFGRLSQLREIVNLPDMSSGGKVVDETIIVIAACCKHLKHVDLRNTEHLTDRGVREIATKLKSSLEVLRLRDCNITGHFVFYIAGCSKLQYLSLTGCYLIDDNCIGRLARACPQLQHLELERCRGISDSGMAHAITDLHELRYLNVSHTSCWEHTLYALKRTRIKLQELHMNGCNRIGVDQKCLEALAPEYLSDLRVVSMMFNGLGFAESDAFMNCVQLEMLHLQGNSFSQIAKHTLICALQSTCTINF
jgi:Leucine Rich repeat